jgi:hypothetical protein
MSKYTTEVRYICEEYAGMDTSVGYGDVNKVVEMAYPKIFDNSLEFYNEETKTRLLPKILLHYYQREISFETVGLWKLKLNQKLREILPYYNQLYKSEDLEYNPLQNVANTHTHKGSDTEDKTETRNLTTINDGQSSFNRDEDTILRHERTTTQGNDTNTHTVDSPLDHWNMFSDTPQGGIDGVQLAGGVGTSGTLSDNAYLTNATHITESPASTHDTLQHGNITETYNANGDKTDHVDVSGWDKTDNTNTHTGTVRKAGTNENEYEKQESGKIGVISYQEMQMKWRESFLNIDMQIIDELSDLFMKVW